MPRAPKNSVFRKSDGRFNVVVDRRQDHTSFRIRAWFTGDRANSEAATAESDAIRAAENIWEAYRKGLLKKKAVEPVNLRELLGLFLERSDLTKKTKGSYERAIRPFLDSAGEERSLRTLAENDIVVWISELTCKEVSKATYLRTLRAFFNWTVEQGWMEANPTLELSIKSRPSMRPWLRHDEWEEFLAACSPAHRIRSKFCLETGLRETEICCARWVWLHAVIGRPAIRVAEDPDTGFVPKWGQPRAVPLSAKAQEALDEAKEMWGPDGFIFSEHLITSPNFARENRKACEKANVTKTDFHGLRRSAGARWLELGIPLHDVSKLLGHRDITTTMRWYAGISDAHLARCMDTVDDADRNPVKNVVPWIRRGGKKQGTGDTKDV